MLCHTHALSHTRSVTHTLCSTHALSHTRSVPHARTSGAASLCAASAYGGVSLCCIRGRLSLLQSTGLAAAAEASRTDGPRWERVPVSLMFPSLVARATPLLRAHRNTGTLSRDGTARPRSWWARRTARRSTSGRSGASARSSTPDGRSFRGATITTSSGAWQRAVRPRL
eukprot:271616-Chlamydomonas_euryale.AAC.1